MTEAPSGTIGDAQARVEALKAKFGGAPSSSPSSSRPPTATAASSPPNPKPATLRAGDAGEAKLEGVKEEKEEEPDRGSLFGTRKASPPMASQSQALPSVVATDVAQVAPAPTPAAREGDIDLGDLEASLGDEGQAGGGDEEDDLDAIIEAARREAEALELGEEGGVDDGESSEEDIDLT